MASNAIIGALRFVLGADTGDMDKAFDSAEGRIAKFGGVVGKAGAVIGASLAAVAVGVGMMVNKTLEEADRMGKAAQKFGIPVEELSRLNYAAGLADVSLDTLGTSVGKLSRNMADAATNATGAAADAFRKMGVSVVDANGNLRSTEDVLADVAEKFKGYQDGAAKTALAMAIFGKSGAEMIPLLNAGRDGLQKSADEAERFGVVIDSQTAAAAENFNDNLRRMSEITHGMWVQVTARVAPALERLSEIFLENKDSGGLMKAAVDAIATAIQFSVQVVLGGIVIYQQLGKELKGLWAVLMAPDWSTMKAAWADYTKIVEESMTRLRNIKVEVDKLFSGQQQTGTIWDQQIVGIQKGSAELERYAQTWLRTSAPIVSAAGAQKNALESFLISQQKSIAATDAQALTVGKSEAEQARLKITQEALAIATANNIPVTDAYAARIAALGETAAAAAMRLQGAMLTQEMLTPAEQYEQKLALQTQLFEAGAISAETYARAQRKASVDAGTAWDVAGSSIAGSFQEIGAAFAKESSAMATVAKIAGAIQATISMFTGAAKALELPFPANLAAMASVLATGAKLVASIKGTSVPKFADGGSMMVGGVGGIDSQRVAMDVSPGEIVQVHKNAYGQSNSDVREIKVAGLDVDRIFSGQQVRNLIDLINDAVANGSRLRFSPV